MTIPTIYQGHFVHPDIWMLWFSFFVSAAGFGSWFFRTILKMIFWATKVTVGGSHESV